MKYILITGATDGIGFESAKRFVASGKNLIIHGRNDDRLYGVKDKLVKINKSVDIKTLKADFEDLKKTAEAFVNIADMPVDTLINNAGTFQKSYKKTKDGFEATYQINHLAHFMITHMLIETLIKNAPSKIIIVSSMAHSNDINFDMLKNKEFPYGYEGYAQSKLCNILFAFRLNKMLKNRGISVNCLHPGVINTKLLVDNWGFCGANTQEAYKMMLFAYELPHSISGEYLKDFKTAKATKKAYDGHYQDMCYDISYAHIKKVLYKCLNND